MARVRLVVLGIVLLGAAIGAWLPGSASAALHNPIPADASGDPNDTFADNQSLWAYFQSDIGGGRICVVPENGPLEVLSCDHPAKGMGTATTIGASIGTIYTLVKNSPMAPGTYRLLVEDSAKTPLETSIPFTVSPCVGCPESPDADVVNAFKAAAAANSDRMGGMCELHGTLEKLGGKAIGLRGIKKKVEAKVTGTLSYATPTFVLTLSGSLTFGFTVEDPLSMGIEKALDIMKEVSCGAKKMYADMAADPPDPNFNQVAQPQPLSIDPLNGSSLDSAVRSVDLERAYVEATLHAFERYQGAKAASDVGAQITQLHAAGDNASALSLEVGRSAEALRAWATDAANDPELAGTILSSSDAPKLAALYQRVRDSGFTADEIQQFHDRGYTDADIADIRTHASLGVADIPVDTTYPDALRAIADGLESEADAIADFASEMYADAGRLGGTAFAARDDSITTDEDVPASVNVLTNDSGPGTLTITAQTNPADGSASCGGDSCTYYPGADFHGSDSFTYTISDGTDTATATVNVTVNEVNDPPAAVGDEAELAVGVSQADIDVLANDSPGPQDEAGQTLTVDSVSNEAAGGTVSIVGGKVRYVPNPGFGGLDTFHYHVCDNGTIDGSPDPQCSNGAVRVIVHSNPPTPADDTAATDEDTPVTIDVLANDTDPDGDTVTVESSDQPQHGTVSCSGDGGCVYVPNPNYNGPDSFTYSASDGKGERASAHVNLTVRAVNDAPNAGRDRLATPHGVSGTVKVLGNDSDVEGDSLTVTGSADGAHGTASCTPQGECTYTPGAGYSGADTFKYTVSDGHGGSTEGTVLVIVTLAEQPSGVSDSKGKDFWVAFPSNYAGGGTTMSLFITGDRSTTGTVEIPGLSFSANIAVTAGDVTTVVLPDDVQLQQLDEVQNRGVHVTAGDEVTVYGLSRQQFTTDAYLGLPTDILGTEYVVQAWKNGGFGWDGSEVTVVGTQPGTKVTITPTAEVSGKPAGVPFAVTLDAGQAYQLMALGFGTDLTGTTVSADKPVAVLGGHRCANVPDDQTGACDHVVEEMPPTSTWGKQFVTVPLATRRNGDTFRVLASEDGTHVSIDGREVATLDRGKFDQQLIADPSVITADKPILVAQFSNGSSFDGVTSDPFMMLVPPYEQFLGAYTVTTPATGFGANFINLAVPNAAVGSVRLDGIEVPASKFSPVGSSGFSAAQLEVELGTHVLEGPLPFGAFMYGFDSFDSYGYPGGLSLAPVARATKLALGPEDSTGTAGTQHCVTAVVTDDLGAPLAGIRVDFAVTGDNAATGFKPTGASGDAQFCYTGANAGRDTITATVGTISDTASRTWTSGGGGGPTQKPTKIDYTGRTSVQYSDSLRLAGKLLDSSVTPNVPLPGKQLGFTLGSQIVAAGPTDGAGAASKPVYVRQRPGSVSSIRADFAGDTAFLGSSYSGSFTILKEYCGIKYAGSVNVSPGAPASLAADLGERDISLGDLSGKALMFTVTDSHGAARNFGATTNAAGHAATQAQLVPGAYSVAVTFAGDAYYNACATDMPALVTVEAPLPTNDPPACTNGYAAPRRLWPPNHKFRLVTFTGVSDPDGDALTYAVTGVTQDEALNGKSDGNTTPDAKLAQRSDQLYLRAEREGGGDGRVYRITYRASDGKSGSCTGTTTVIVPHDESGRTAVDSGLRIDSFGVGPLTTKGKK